MIVSRFLLGPTELTGDTLAGASAGLDQSGIAWQVNPVFKAGADGIDQFNRVAAECVAGAETCPTTQLAIVLDSEVISAPTIQQPSFERDQIVISGDFDESSAKNLALVLEYGALPVELEPQQTQTVSATLGEDSLRAGLISGLIGLFLTVIFMIGYYRLLGVVAIASLVLEFALVWALISYLGESRGLALTLAGVTGLIVSIGISVDSNVVFYEHLKEDVRNGRTFRSTVDRSFDSSFSTIIKADVASLIGAVLLYYLSVGPGPRLRPPPRDLHGRRHHRLVVLHPPRRPDPGPQPPLAGPERGLRHAPHGGRAMSGGADRRAEQARKPMSRQAKRHQR